MKVLLISTNQEYFAHRITPIGILYLAAALKQKNHEVQVLDLMFSGNPFKDIRIKIKEFSPDLVGISLRNLDTMITKGISLLGYQQACLKEVRKNTTSIIILGGPGFTIAPIELMTILDADYGIAGEADLSLPEFVSRLENRQDLQNIPGLVYRTSNEIYMNPSLISQGLDSIPFQAIDLIDCNKYKRKRGFIGILIKRSCTQNCIFCDERKLYGDHVRLRSPKRIVDEIEYIHQQTGMVYFDFADALFNSPPRYMVDVLKELLERKLKIRFKVELNPVGQNDESVRLLKLAGCIGVDYSPDTGSDRMLINLRKGFTKEKIIQVAGLYEKYKLPYSAGFILGGPGEDLSTIRETISLARQLPKVSVVYFNIGFTLGGMHSDLEKLVSDRAVVKVPDLLEVKYFIDEGFDRECARLVLQACKQRNDFYLCDTFTSPSMNFFWRISDILNLRPIWKYGRVPSLVMRLTRSGKEIFSWNEQLRRFTSNS